MAFPRFAGRCNRRRPTPLLPMSPNKYNMLGRTPPCSHGGFSSRAHVATRSRSQPSGGGRNEVARHSVRPGFCRKTLVSAARCQIPLGDLGDMIADISRTPPVAGRASAPLHHRAINAQALSRRVIAAVARYPALPCANTKPLRTQTRMRSKGTFLAPFRLAAPVWQRASGRLSADPFALTIDFLGPSAVRPSGETRVTGCSSFETRSQEGRGGRVLLRSLGRLQRDPRTLPEGRWDGRVTVRLRALRQLLQDLLHAARGRSRRSRAAALSRAPSARPFERCQKTAAAVACSCDFSTTPARCQRTVALVAGGCDLLGTLSASPARCQRKVAAVARCCAPLGNVGEVPCMRSGRGSASCILSDAMQQRLP